MLHGDTMVDLARAIDQARSEELARSVTSARSTSAVMRTAVGRVLVRTGERLLGPPARASTP